MLEFLYVTAVIISISASLPQLKQLIAAKASDEFSVMTWLVWFCTQLVTLAYVISIENMLMIGANILWAGFYAAMLYLILHYRRTRKVVVVETVSEA